MRQKLVEELLDLADVDGCLRPFELSIEEFNRICTTYLKICERHPSLIKYDSRSEGGMDDLLLANCL